MAYTKQDYDNVISLYREYESKKDSYTPIQQQQIENAFANAWSKVSQRTEESNYKQIVWVRMDPQWNTINQYNDWTEETVKVADKPNPEIMNTNNINVPETTQTIDAWTQITPEPVQTQTPTVIQTNQAPQTQTWIKKPTAQTWTNWRTWNTWVYPVWSSKEWTLMSDWSVRPATYNPSYNQPSKTQSKILPNNPYIPSTPFSNNLRRLISSWYYVDKWWYLYNPQWNKVARVWTWSIL